MVAERVSWSGVRKVGARLTTPLHPDDYLSLINPCGLPASCVVASRR